VFHRQDQTILPSANQEEDLMLQTILTRIAFASALLAVSGGSAVAFNPQPEPPGKSPSNWQLQHLPLCSQLETASRVDPAGGQDKTTTMRKAGGEQHHYVVGHSSNGGKCLNPQPLPPG
jgi:hypothetical protein